jgi:hypothetical protein
LFIDVDALHRTGINADRTPVTFTLVQPDPVFPAQCLMGAGRYTFVVLAGQTDPHKRLFRPVPVDVDTGTFDGILAEMGPRTDGHANFTFRAERTIEFQHFKPLFLSRLMFKLRNTYTLTSSCLQNQAISN